jgi:tetratricopeptide (TPR) repeat protein
VIALCSLGDSEKAITCYRDAFYYATQLENSFSQALITNNLGTAYMELQRYDEAREAFEDSLIACRKIGDREGESIALSNMGEIDLELENDEEAVECNLEALEIAVEIDSAWLKCRRAPPLPQDTLLWVSSTLL